MKKRNIVRNVSLVALSAILVCGTAVAFAGCGGGKKPYELTVKVFCDAADEETNRKICDDWAKRYTEKLHADGTIPADKSITVKFLNDPQKGTYFTTLDNTFSGGNSAVEDIIYMSPKYTRVWAENGRVMDLSQYFTEDDYESVSKLWANAVSFYGYSHDGYRNGDYKLGDAISYQENGAEGMGYYNANGVKTGLYALPKDYSNFSMGFNNKFFTENMKIALTNRKATQVRNVRGALDLPRGLTYSGGTGNQMDKVVTYAVGGAYTNPYTGETMTATQGGTAPLINIGVPTTYKPFNFYAFATYQDAVNGGDPVALAVEAYTGGQGYTVTIPGFPGETFEMPTNAPKDANAYYDTSWGHITLTYAEYSALSWAVSYYCNTFEWTQINKVDKSELVSNGKFTTSFSKDLIGVSGDDVGWPKSGNDVYSDKADQYEDGIGRGGLRLGNGLYENVYANDQYEGPPNPTLYLLPWLAGNDADFINSTSDKAVQDGVETDISKLNENTKLGTATEKVAKLRLSGATEQVDVQYGVNSERFVETYAAFLAYGSDWNANSGNAGSVKNEQKSSNGQDLYLAGANIFYGTGTWDGKTNNEAPLDLCEFRLMPEPVSERYALYSKIKDMNYNMKEYQWDSTAHEAKTTPAAGDIYDTDEIIANQVDRQDKWGARMDSVGYAVNKYVETNSTGEAAWKTKGAVSLVLALTANEEDQRNLLYGGAQLPNFVHQCVELLQYQNDKYSGNGLEGKGIEAGATTDLTTNGTFKDMLTPEGWASTQYYQLNDDGTLKFENKKPALNAEGVAKAQRVWALYCDVATQMSNAAVGGSTQTVKQFIEKYNTENLAKITAAGETEIKYDPNYASAVLNTMPGTRSKIATAMKYLRMVTYTRADRDIDLRMQYGLNSVRDSAMYTYQDGWIGLITMRTNGIALAYDNQRVIEKGSYSTLADALKGNVTTNPGEKVVQKYQTPFVYCLRTAGQVKEDLQESIDYENMLVG